LNEARQSILEKKQLVKPLVYSVAHDPLVKRGTKVIVKGWGDHTSITKDFRLEELERYLRFYTVAGYTKLNARERPLPEVTISVSGAMKTLKPGFPYITTTDTSEETKTVVFDPIEVTKQTPKGKQVKIVLKGGITLETKKYNLTELTGGVWVSVNGIPYFKLLTNKYARKLYMSDDFVRFVVESDDIRLNLSRTAIASGDDKDAFEDALQEAFNKIKEDPKFERFYQTWKRELDIKAQERMAQKKQDFLMPEQRFVWFKGRQLIAEPESEQDVAALLWILEGGRALPFHHFRTLQYPGYYEDVDMLIEMQEDKESERQLCVYAELEMNFSSLIKHGHAISQMSYAFCWKVDKHKVSLGNIQQTKKPWKHSYTVSDKHIIVYEISSFPEIFVGTRQEAKEHFGRIE
jgi:hypothetical protein